MRGHIDQSVKLSDILNNRPPVYNKPLILQSQRIRHIDPVKKTFHKVKEINLESNLIDRLDGLEQFTELVVLDLRNNKISDQNELMKLTRCPKLQKVLFEGNPFTTYPLTPVTKSILYTLQIDLPLFNFSPATLSTLLTNHSEQLFLESLFRKLDLHTELTNEYVMEDCSQRDYGYMVRNRKMFVGICEDGRQTLLQEVQDEKGVGESDEEAADRVIVKQRERVEELARLVQKKWEILNGVRRIAEKGKNREDSPSVRFSTGFNSAIAREFMLTSEPADSKVTPLGNGESRLNASDMKSFNEKPTLTSKCDIQNEDIESRQPHNSELHYKMLLSKLSENQNSNVKPTKSKQQQAIAKTFKSKQRIEKKIVKQQEPFLTNRYLLKSHPELHSLLANENISRNQIAKMFQSLLERSDAKLREQESTVKKLTATLEQTNKLKQQISQVCRTQHTQLNSQSQQIQELTQSLSQSQQQLQTLQSPLQALITTQHNEQLLMKAKQIELKGRFFALMMCKAHKLQRLRIIKAYNEEQEAKALRKKVFWILMREVVIKRMGYERRTKREVEIKKTCWTTIRKIMLQGSGLKGITQQRRRRIITYSIRKLVEVHRNRVKSTYRKIQVCPESFYLHNLKRNSFQNFKMSYLNKKQQLLTLTNSLSQLIINSQTHSAFIKFIKKHQTKGILQSNSLILKKNLQNKTVKRFIQNNLHKKFLLNSLQQFLKKISRKLINSNMSIFIKRQALRSTRLRQHFTKFLLGLLTLPKPLEPLITSIQSSIKLHRLHSLTHQTPSPITSYLFHRRFSHLLKLFNSWRVCILTQKNRNSCDRLESMQGLLTELRDKENRVIRLQTVWKEQLQKKDERLLMFQKKFEQLGCEIIQKDIRYEKLKAIYGETIGQMRNREMQFIHVVDKVNQANEFSGGYCAPSQVKAMGSRSCHSHEKQFHPKVSEFSATKYQSYV